LDVLERWWLSPSKKQEKPRQRGQLDVYRREKQSKHGLVSDAGKGKGSIDQERVRYKRKKGGCLVVYLLERVLSGAWKEKGKRAPVKGNRCCSARRKRKGVEGRRRGAKSTNLGRDQNNNKLVLKEKKKEGIKREASSSQSRWRKESPAAQKGKGGNVSAGGRREIRWERSEKTPF